ncbi:MAG: three-Cys-motif partner protein TcmP [Desulfotomaculales bacterium]
MDGGVLWEKAPHTEMKHEILRRYLEAWLPILGSWNDRLAIIDGFAGPGEYEGGELGSPPIILDTIIRHKLKDRVGEIVLLFIEKDGERADFLEKLLVRRYFPAKIGGAAYELEGGRIKFQVVKGEFEATLKEILDGLQERGAQLVPCFAFIDPFGPSGMPMELIARYMAHPKSETLINFALDAVNRFLTAPTHEKIFDELYGCPDWRRFRSVEGAEQHRGLLELYISQLKSVAGAEYVLPFLMKDDRNRDLYHLVFATKHWRGLDVMKQAMWRTDPTGNFQFSDYTYDPNQLHLFPPKPDFRDLAELVWQNFRGQTVTPREIEEWVVVGTRYARNLFQNPVHLVGT